MRNASKTCVEAEKCEPIPVESHVQPRTSAANTFPLLCILKQSTSGYFRELSRPLTLNPADVNGRLILFLLSPPETLNHTQTHANARWQSQFHTLLHTSAPTPVLHRWQQVTQSQSCCRRGYKEKENVTKRSVCLSCLRPSSPGKAPRPSPHVTEYKNHSLATNIRRATTACWRDIH